LACFSIEGADALLEAVQDVLQGIKKEAFQAVFLEWMDWLRKCIATTGEHID
jgi:hypothetical protein